MSVERISIPISSGVGSLHCPPYRFFLVEMTLDSIERNSKYEHDVIIVSETPESIIPEIGPYFEVLKKRWPWVNLIDARELYSRVLAKDYLPQPRGPIYECFNEGAKYAKTDWIMILVGDDTYFPPLWDEKLLSHVDFDQRERRTWIPRFLSTRAVAFDTWDHPDSIIARYRYTDYAGENINNRENPTSKAEFFGFFKSPEGFKDPLLSIKESEVLKIGEMICNNRIISEGKGRGELAWPYNIVYKDLYWKVGGFREDMASGADSVFDDDLFNIGNIESKVGVFSTFICNSHCKIILGE